MKTRKISLPAMTRVAAVLPKTINKKDRTVDVIFTKGARVLRRGFFETFFEELGLEKDNVRMGRLESGRAPVLDTHGLGHRGQGLGSVLGVVESAKLIPGVEGRAKLRFSKRDDVTPVFQDIEDGIIRNISFGYTTFRFEKVGEDNGIPIFRATDWEPSEISPVPAGADGDAFIRSQEQNLTECVFFDPEKENEGDDPAAGTRNLDAGKNTTEKPAETPAKTPVKTDPPAPDATRNAQPPAEKTKNENETLANPENVRETDSTTTGGNETMTPEEIAKIKLAARNEGIKEGAKEGASNENKRQLEIRSIVKKSGVKAELADTYIKEEKTLDEVRTLVIDALAAKDAKPENETRATNISVGEDLARKGRVEGMTSALLHRFRPKAVDTRNESGQKMTLPGYELNDAARSYAYFSLIDMARSCLELGGHTTGMYPKHRIADIALNNDQVRGLHSISDFPEILANVANKTLRGGYLAAPKTWGPFTNEVFVADFKEISRTNLGDAPKLEKLEEGSEVKHGTISEAAEKYQVEEFAKIIAISRKVIINDDLGAFTRIPERMGRRAADLESDTVWDIIKANAALADTFALYSAQHGNLSTAPAAPSETGLSEGRKLMRRQVGLDGAEISLTPVWLYVPPEHETAAEKLIASIVPDSSTNVSPFSSAGRTPLRLDVEPRLETGGDGSLTSWFLMADKGQVDMIELARLEGTDGPQIQSRDGFEVNGMQIKVMHDIGAKAIDFRGLFKNAGA